MPRVSGYMPQFDQPARAKQVEHVLAVGKAQDGAGQDSGRPGPDSVRSPGRGAAARDGRRRDRSGPGTTRAAARTRGWRPCLAAGPRGSSRRCRGPCRERCAGRRPRSRPRRCRWAPADRWVSPSIKTTRPVAPCFWTLPSPSTSISRQKSVPMTRREALRGAVIGQGEVGRAGAAIEHRNSGFGGNRPGGEPPPGAIDVQAQQVVQQIVPPRDRREHPPHPLVGLVDLHPLFTNCRERHCRGLMSWSPRQFATWFRREPSESERYCLTGRGATGDRPTNLLWARRRVNGKSPAGCHRRPGSPEMPRASAMPPTMKT